MPVAREEDACCLLPRQVAKRSQSLIGRGEGEVLRQRGLVARQREFGEHDQIDAMLGGDVDEMRVEAHILLDVAS